ncbi:hypothetical protein GGS23DRAFT_605974 [Durotheca rogersii]|uniref:uncharacterized protein n=1 Tax=Durotheca rogersii TaxID=419775 RepID=UPI002220DBF4|nr:uncharacterized protein GGS23DRAFT_605974 [Durotheca rogersii]KAI5862072.1 hypothetical protein GGS23DRAFT_605974 [Durotheca rogersii]
MPIQSPESNLPKGQPRPVDRPVSTIPVVSSGLECVDNVSTSLQALPPSPTYRSPPTRHDSLSLRLRSNSGLALHTNDAALSKYIKYKKSWLRHPSSCDHQDHPLPLDEDVANSSFYAKMPWATGNVDCAIYWPEFLGEDVHNIALDNPAVCRKFMGYCKEEGYEGYFEFLVKVREYTKSINEMTSALTAISTSFIVPGATHSLNLPTTLSRTLSADMKRIAHTTLPNLEGVFQESKAHVESRVATSIFPKFVKSQLLHYMTAVLMRGAPNIAPSKSELPGLGEGFCIVDASGSTINAVTGAFLRITGYHLQDAVRESRDFVHDAKNHTESAGLLGQGREAVELLLNPRKDGEPFWSMCFLYPLRDRDKQLRCWLGAQVDVSAVLRTRNYLLRVLASGDYPESASEDVQETESEQSFKAVLATEPKFEKDRSVHSRESSRSSTSRNRFLHQFRRPSRTPYFPPFPESPDTNTSDTAENRPTQGDHFSTQRSKLPAHIRNSPTVYSRHVLLQCHSPRSARSPSVTKSFRSTIRDRIERGKSTSAEILVHTNRTIGKRLRTTISGGRPKTAEVDNTKDETNPRAARGSVKSPRPEPLMSHWTPMRDADGSIGLVVLILVPQL